mmetsp:Transcript_16573/g.57828  ORF Transcript_16573/g.57828 Transcript_16573/m.57828 type:complete len:378 (-) Transcript_16573:172-1305(-)
MSTSASGSVASLCAVAAPFSSSASTSYSKSSSAQRFSKLRSFALERRLQRSARAHEESQAAVPFHFTRSQSPSRTTSLSMPSPSSQVKHLQSRAPARGARCPALAHAATVTRLPQCAQAVPGPFAAGAPSSEEEEEEEEEAAVEAPPTPVVAPPLAPVAPSSVKYQYYQTPTHVTITVLAKGITAETAEIVIEDKSLVVRVVIGGFEMTVINGELYDPVVKDKASVKFLSTKVEIKLPKKEAFNWNELLIGACIGDDPAKRAHPPPRTTSAGATATATPYSSKRDWRRLEKDCEAELAAEAPEGEEALNKLFQDIYGKATPETRRAMNKSFQTSGGTVLSTNWGEVGTTNYEEERQAPAGMEWKTWEGAKLPQKEDN